MESPQHASAKSEYESACASNHSPEDSVQYVAVPQAYLPSERLKWQSPSGGRKNGRVFPYGEKRTGDGDFGPATLVEQDGSLLLVYESKRHKGRTFRFELTQNTITHKYFRCKDCVEYARLAGSQVDRAVKSVGVCNGRLVTDPDKPKGKAHMCMKQKQIPQPKQDLTVAMSTQSAKCTSSSKPESFGRAEYADNTKSHLVYKSRLYPGTTFRFLRTNRYLNRTYYDCSKCRAVNAGKKLNIRLGTVIVCDDEIVGRDPDLPHGKIGHICVQAPQLPGASAAQSCEEFVITEDAADDFYQLCMEALMSTSQGHAEPDKARSSSSTLSKVILQDIATNPAPEVAKSREDDATDGGNTDEEEGQDRELTDVNARDKDAAGPRASQPNAAMEMSFEDFLILEDPTDGLKEHSEEASIKKGGKDVAIEKENAADAVPLAAHRNTLEDDFVGEDHVKDHDASKKLVGSGSHDNGVSAKKSPTVLKHLLQPAPKRFGRVIFDDKAKEKIVYYNNGSHGFKFDLLVQNVTAAGIRRKYRCSACFEASGRTGINCAVAIALDKYFVDVDPAAPNGKPNLNLFCTSESAF